MGGPAAGILLCWNGRQRRGRAGIFPVALVRGAAAALVIAISPLMLVGAPQAARNSQFEVASVKPSNGAPIGVPGTDAFGLVDFQEQIRGPAWISKDEYAIDAHVPPGTTKEQFQVMLQNLLVERFKLAVHHETVMLPVYQMVVTKGGVRFKESVPAEAGVVPAPPPTGSDRDGFPLMPPGRPGMSATYSSGSNGQQQSRWRAQQQTMEAFARMLGLPSNAGRIVVDKTGLTEKYDFTLFFDIPQPGVAADAANPSLSIFDALQEQLGLKLIDAKQSFDKIVIDHAERVPVGN